MQKTGVEAVKEVIKFAELARQLGVTRGGIQNWTRVPAERIGQVSKITGLRPEILRPDLFPDAGAAE